MSNVLMFERTSASFVAGSRTSADITSSIALTNFNHCPGCGRSRLVYRPRQRRMRFLWNGRAACRGLGAGKCRPARKAPPRGTYRRRRTPRRFPRMPTKGRKLQLLIDGSPVHIRPSTISRKAA